MLLLIFLLSILVIFTFDKKAVAANPSNRIQKNSRLFIFSGTLFLAFLIARELDLAQSLLPVFFAFLAFLPYGPEKNRLAISSFIHFCSCRFTPVLEYSTR